ncbi:tetratricopeptide repeat protein [Streptomyces sp. NPDC012637]|uniref:tetratricopeptide repeat protein n=1 Tax=Streptomyces sp. NPDC012637 TaxID=3364842 RepID=UPI0036EEB394
MYASVGQRRLDGAELSPQDGFPKHPGGIVAGRVRLWLAYFVLAVLAGLAGVIAAIWMPPERAAAVAAIAAAITALPVTRVSARIDTATRQRELMSASLYAASATGRLPRVRDLIDPIALGVHAAETVVRDGVTDRVAPFIQRDREADVHAAVTKGGFVLIVGESTAGKTRLAYEALHTLRPNHAFAYPAPSALHALLPAAQREKNCVVWLDDLERYLGAQGLTAQLLTQLLGDNSRNVLVIATMRAHEHQQFLSPHTEVPPEERAMRERTTRELLQSARTIRIDRHWSAAERARAAEHATDPRLARAVEDDRFGIAETLACGPTMLESWRNAWAPGGHPRAAAVMAAAVDCRRLGMHAPVTSAVLADLHCRYLEDRGGDRLRPEPMEEALAWLCTPVHGATGSLLISAAGGYQAFDYLLDVPDLQPVPEGMALALASLLDPEHAHNVGLAAGRLGHWEEAYQIHHAVVAERVHVLGSDHPDTLASRYEVGFALSRTGRAADALREYSRVTEGRERTLGADHADTLTARQETAYVLGQLGRHFEAHQVYASVLAARERSPRLGPDHPDTLRCRHNLAYHLSRLGRPEDSYHMARNVAAARARVLGADHPDTLSTRYEVAHTLGQLGRWNEALQTYCEVAEARHQALGADHLDTLAARYEVGVSLGRLGRSAEALTLYRDLIDDRTRVNGPNAPETLRARHGLGVNLGRLGRWEEALDEARNVCAIRERVLGADHPDTLVSGREVAVGLGWLDRWADALTEYRKVAAARERALGRDHPDALASRNDEAHCLEQLSRSQEATEGEDRH